MFTMKLCTPPIIRRDNAVPSKKDVSPSQEERPTKRRIVLALVYFRFNKMVQHVLTDAKEKGGKVRTQEFIREAYTFLQDFEQFDQILESTCSEQLYQEDDGRIKTVVMEFRLVDECVEKFKALPWKECKILGARGLFFNSATLDNCFAQESLNGIWVAKSDSSRESSTSSASATATSKLEPPTQSYSKDRSASRPSAGSASSDRKA